MEIRTITFNDVFELSRIVDKLGIKFEKGLKTDVEVGADFILKIMQNTHKAKNEVNNFLGSLFSISGEEFGELPLSEVMNCMKQLTEHEDFGSFLQTVSKFMSSK